MQESDEVVKGRILALLVVAVLVVAAPAASAPGQTPKNGGTVTFGPVAESSCLNPLATCGIGPQALWIWEKVLPSAFALGPDVTWRPMLVSDVDHAAGTPFTVTYHIRPEARWSDGVPVTARDFVFTHEALVSQLPSLEGHPHGLIESLHVVDPKTLEVGLRVRTVHFRELFHNVLPRHALAGQDLGKLWTDGIDDPRSGRPIGSGPFLVGDWQRGKRLVLVRNPRWWGPHRPYLDRLVVRFCEAACQAPSSREVVESVRSGAVDFTYARDAEIVPGLRRIRGTMVRINRTNGWEHLTLRLGPGGHPALKSRLVRQALAYGIDRAEIVRQLWAVVDRGYRPLHSAVFLRPAPGYAPNWRGYTYRPDVARRLLERAGCRRGADGIYSCGGERLSLRFFTSLGTPQRVHALELMRPQLRRAGIEVQLSYATFPALVGILTKGEFDAAQFAFILDTGFGRKATYGCRGRTNVTGYCRPTVTADLERAERIVDDARRAELLARVDRQLARDVPLIPLYQIPWVYAYRNHIRNVVPSPDNLFWNAENWWLDD